MAVAKFQGFVVPVNQFIHDRVTEMVSLIGLYDQVNFAALPGAGMVRLGGRIWGGPGGTHQFRIDITNAQGHVVSNMADQQFKAPDISTSVQHTFGVEVGIEVQREGLYQVRLVVDDKVISSHPLIIKKVG